MRIAHLTWSLGIGGAQTLLVKIVNFQVSKGNEVAIFEVDTYVSKTIVEKIDPRVKIFYLGRTRGKKAVLPFIRLNWYLRKFNPDIIHSHAGKLINVVFSNKPKVATIHGMKDWPNDYRKYDRIYAISKSVHDDWVKKGNDKTVVIENGIDCSSIKIKKNFSLDDTIHAVVVSRIYLDVKGQDIIVKALSKLNESGFFSRTNKRIIVHFVGGGVDSDKLEKMSKDLGVSNQVVLEGFKAPDWVYNNLYKFDLFIQASRWEGFGLTVAEACAAKLPVIISAIDGPLEILDGGKLGWTFESGNHSDLAEKIEQFVIGKYDYSLINKAYQHIMDCYDINKTSTRYLEEYNLVLNEKR